MSPTMPRTGPLADSNRAERRSYRLKRADHNAAMDRTFRGIVPRAERTRLGKLGTARTKSVADRAREITPR